MTTLFFCDGITRKPAVTTSNQRIALEYELAKARALYTFDPADDDVLERIADLHAEILKLDRARKRSAS